CRPTCCELPPSCLAAATAGSGSSPPAAPATSSAAGGRSRWLGESTLRLPSGLRILDLGLRPVAASARLSADTARLRRTARRFCAPTLGPRPVRSAPLLPVLLSHTLQPVAHENTAA